MSHLMYIASDQPLPEKINPHERFLTLRQAQAEGMDIQASFPSWMNLEEVDLDSAAYRVLVCDREIVYNEATGKVEDGDFDDDFRIQPVEEPWPDMSTAKAYCAVFEWNRYTPGRAQQLISYIRQRLEETEEIELWSVWMDGDDQDDHDLITTDVQIDDLQPRDICDLDRADFGFDNEVCTDHRYIIVR